MNNEKEQLLTTISILLNRNEELEKKNSDWGISSRRLLDKIRKLERENEMLDGELWYLNDLLDDIEYYMW